MNEYKREKLIVMYYFIIQLDEANEILFPTCDGIEGKIVE